MPGCSLLRMSVKARLHSLAVITNVFTGCRHMHTQSITNYSRKSLAVITNILARKRENVQGTCMQEFSTYRQTGALDVYICVCLAHP